MTTFTGTIGTATSRQGHGGTIAHRALRGIAGRVGVAFNALREAISAAQMGPMPQDTTSRWAGARA